MHLTSLSWLPHRPCMLLQWPSLTVLLDCAVDLSTLSSFMPVKLNSGSRLAKFPIHHPVNSYLKRYGDEVFVDSRVEVHPALLKDVRLDSVDAILISNCMSLFALPFISESSGFRGLIYTTPPVLELGRLTALEFIEFIESDDRSCVDSNWKDPKVYATFPNKPTTDPCEWKSFYSREQFENAISKVNTVSFLDPINLHNIVEITAYSSGYSIGACNWIIRTETEKVAYIAASSSRTSHMKAATWEQFRSADALVLSSLSRFPDLNPETSVCNVCAVAVDTLKKNGSVLMPVSPTGVVYDLFEVIAHQMDQQNVSQDVPIYFISPVANETLVFSNISMEWLSEKKQEYFYLPDQAFAHGKMLKSGKLKVYKTTHGDFSRQMRTPCITFCGHPSLRLGDAIQFLELWGTDSRNAIIMTDPDYPLGDVYGPYRNLAIRAFFYPIDTRLDYTQLNSAILPDLAPKSLFIPDVYSKPPIACPQRLDCVINYEPRLSFHYGKALSTVSLTKRKRVMFTPEHFPKLTFRASNVSNNLSTACIDSYLSAFDNKYYLKSLGLTKKETDGLPPIRPSFEGILDADIMLNRVREIDPASSLKVENQISVICVPLLNGELHILDNGSRLQIHCDSDKDSQKLLDVVTPCFRKVSDL